MLTLNSPQVVQETALRWKRENKLALVPTMGCLHEGHLSLVRRAKQLGQKVIVSIFVNPLQFGPNEDFEKYPRSFASDSEKLDALGVDLLFHPSVKDLYPEGFATRVQLTGLTSALEGKSRPGHFDGVATVVLKLFQVVQPDFAIFGEKDYQQLRVIERMTADLNLPIMIVAHETVREADGLALSSRNRYLSPDDRRRALAIPETLREAARLAASNENVTAGEIVKAARKILESSPLDVDYAQVASAADIAPLEESTLLSSVAEPRIFIAARAGTTRLIDNGPLRRSAEAPK